MELAENAIVNSGFEFGLLHWYANNGGHGSCKAQIADIQGDKNSSKTTKHAIVSGRQETWHGLAQNIKPRFDTNCSYLVSATTSVAGVTSSEVRAVLCLKFSSRSGEPTTDAQYIWMGRTQVSSSSFTTLHGSFKALSSDCELSDAVAYLEGPPPGADLLVSQFTMTKITSPAPSSTNIIHNSDFEFGVFGWKGFVNSETLVPYPAEQYGSPLGPPACPSSLPLTPALAPVLARPTAAYIRVGNRREEWQGLRQGLESRLSPFVTYALSAWVRLGPGTGQQGEVSAKVEMRVQIEGLEGNEGTELLHCGAVMADSRSWKRCLGTLRVERALDAERDEVFLHILGPPAGIEIWVASVAMVPVQARDRSDRLTALKRRAMAVRGGRGTVRVTDSAGRGVEGATVQLRQKSSSFPIGTCISREGLRDAEYCRFVLGHFSHVVFENELKWQQMEPQRGQLRTEAADFMLDWAEAHGLLVRGHCLAWETELPPWLLALPDKELAGAVDARLQHVLSRYRGRFIHYDVDNEMLRCSHIADRLGRGAVVQMFQACALLDSSAALFVNEYGVLDGSDCRSTADRYKRHVEELLEMGAAVSGVGVQGHLAAPVGSHIQAALDTLGALRIPIWITELDVRSRSQRCRADDLEAVLWEAFAHPSVAGVMLWGFREGAMYTRDAHLVNADGSLSEAGVRLEQVLRDWRGGALDGVTGAGGELQVEGLCGLYAGRVQAAGAEVRFELELRQGGSAADNVVSVECSL